MSETAFAIHAVASLLQVTRFRGVLYRIDAATKVFMSVPAYFGSGGPLDASRDLWLRNFVAERSAGNAAH